MLDQQTAAQPVDGRDIGSFDSQRCCKIAVRNERAPDPLPQFPGGGFGKGNREDLLGPHLAVPDPLGEGLLDMVGFARPCPCGYNRKFSHLDRPEGLRRERCRRA